MTKTSKLLTPIVESETSLKQILRNAHEVMTIQEGRMDESMHLSAEAFTPMWNKAKEGLQQALEAEREFTRGMDRAFVAKIIVKMTEATYALALSGHTERDREVMRMMNQGSSGSVGSLVVIGSVRATVPHIMRFGRLIKAEMEPYPTQEEYDPLDEEPEIVKRLVHTIEGLDGKEYRWENVSLLAVPVNNFDDSRFRNFWEWG